MLLVAPHATHFHEFAQGHALQASPDDSKAIKLFHEAVKSETICFCGKLAPCCVLRKQCRRKRLFRSSPSMPWPRCCYTWRHKTKQTDYPRPPACPCLTGVSTKIMKFESQQGRTVNAKEKKLCTPESRWKQLKTVETDNSNSKTLSISSNDFGRVLNMYLPAPSAFPANLNLASQDGTQCAKYQLRDQAITRMSTFC